MNQVTHETFQSLHPPAARAAEAVIRAAAPWIFVGPRGLAGFDAAEHDTQDRSKRVIEVSAALADWGPSEPGEHHATH